MYVRLTANLTVVLFCRRGKDASCPFTNSNCELTFAITENVEKEFTHNRDLKTIEQLVVWCSCFPLFKNVHKKSIFNNDMDLPRATRIVAVRHAEWAGSIMKSSCMKPSDVSWRAQNTDLICPGFRL